MPGFFLWDRVDLQNAGGQKNFADAVNAFLRIPDRFTGDKRIHGALQHFSLTGDFPADIRDLALRVNEVVDIDMGHEAIFDIRDQPEGDGFDIFTIGNTAFTFDELKPGDRTPIRTIAGTKVRVSMADYQDALGWSEETFRRRQFAEVEMGLEQLRAAAYNKRASTFYALIEAVGASAADYQTTWNSDTSASTAVRDARTWNTAAASILTGLKDKGMAISNPSFILLAPYTSRDRVRDGLSVVNQAFAGSPTVTAYPFTPVYSMLLTSTSYFYVILPKRKMLGRYQIPPTLRYGGDLLSNLEYVACKMAFAGGIGASHQVRRCATS